MRHRNGPGTTAVARATGGRGDGDRFGIHVITARSVVERRQQIGVLRAIGFRRRMVQWSFLVESSFIALTSIEQQPSWSNLE
jgi:hypothetical protein